MKRTNANHELWENIHLFTAGRLKGKELEEFESLLAANEEIAEMVAFSRSLDINDILRDPASSSAEKEQILEEVKGNPLLEEELRLNGELGFVAKNRKLLEVIYRVQALNDNIPPGHDPAGDAIRPKSNPGGISGKGKFSRVALLAASGLAVLLVLGIVAGFWGLFSKETAFPDVPDYPYVFVEAQSTVGKLYNQKNYEPAMEELKMIRDKSISSGYFEQITINRYEFYIAICQMRLGDLDGARIKLEELARDELNLAGNPETLFLGLIYFKANDFHKAKEWLSQAAESDGYLKNGVPIAQVANRYLEKIGNSM